MIIGILDNLVNQMVSGGKSYLFDTGWSEWLNNSIDEFDSTKGLVLYDSDSPFTLRTTGSGRVVQIHRPNIFFAFKSEGDWSPLEQDNNCVTPSIFAARELIELMEKNNDDINSISVIGDGVILLNEKDVNISGILLQFNIELNVNNSICVGAPASYCKESVSIINDSSGLT